MQNNTSTNITGTVTTTAKGMGFIADPANADKDILIEPGFLNTALNGDTVEITVTGSMPPRKAGEPRTKTAEVVRVTARAKNTFVGTVDTENSRYFVIPDDRKMYTDIAISA